MYGPPVCQVTSTKDPVDIASGKMFHEMVDLRIDGPLPIEFIRRFDSMSSDDLALGYGWQHNGMIRLNDVTNQSTQTLIDRTMRRVAFNCAKKSVSNSAICGGTWQENTIDHLKLTHPSSTSWLVEDKHGTKYTFENAGSTGRLTLVEDRNGNTITYGYTSGNLTSITDSFGRSMGLTYYSGMPRIHTVSAGTRTVTYEYSTDGLHNLTKVTLADGSFESYVSYEYIDSHWPHKFTAAVDDQGHVIEAHCYDDESGRVRHTESDGGNNEYTIDYNDNPSTETTVTDGRTPAVSTVFAIDSKRGVVTDRTGGPGCSACGDGGEHTQKVYDDYFNVMDHIDGTGTRTHMTYDSRGNVLTLTEACVLETCNPGPCVTETCDPAYGRTTTYVYDLPSDPYAATFNLPATISVPSVGDCGIAAKVATNTYSSRGNLTSASTVGCNGSTSIPQTTTYTRDEPTQEDPNRFGQLLTVNGPRDDSNDVLDRTQYQYYPNTTGDVEDRGRLKRVTDAKGHHTDYADYDVFGSVGSVTDPNGVKTVYTYDARDRVKEVRIQEPPDDDIVTQYHYDSVGNLDRVRRPNCVALGTGCAFSLEYIYDHVNRLLQVHDALGNKIVYTYDVEGNRLSEYFVDSSQQAHKFTNFAYDDLNRLGAIRLDPPPKPPALGNPIFYHYEYFEDGSRQSELDPLGHLTTFTYDELKRLQTSTQTVGNGTLTTTYDYDTQDNLISVRDPNGLITEYTYSDFGWRTSSVSPDTGTTTFDYDLAGNLLTSTDANGVVVTREYDELNRPTTTNYPDIAPNVPNLLNVKTEYDFTTVAHGIGRRTRLLDASGTSTFGYDRRGLVTTEQKTLGGMTFGTRYDFDLDGNLTTIDYPAVGSSSKRGTVNFEYDELDRPSRVTALVNGTTTTVASEFDYEPFGPRSTMTFGNTLVDTRSFDSRYQLKNWTLGNLLNYTNAFNDDGNLTGRVDHATTANNRTFDYDEAHRLTNATGPWCVEASCAVCPESKTYTYDLNGNRICKGESGNVTNYYPVTDTNRLDHTTGGEATNYSYDDNGNTVNDGVHSYHYNQANRLDSVAGGTTATYVYDGDSRRVSKTVGTTTTYFFYDPSGRLIQEMNPATGLGKDYIYVDGAPLARVDWAVAETSLGNVLKAYKSSSNVHLDWSAYSPTGDSYVVRRKQVVDTDDKSFDGALAITTLDYPRETYDDPVVGNGNRYDYELFKQTKADALFYYHTDHLGTPIAMTSGSSAFVWKEELRPFGDVSGASSFNNLRFPGQYFDSETGLHQNWFRDYAPKTGRFSQADPIGLDGGINVYSYATHNPTRLTDRFGLDTVGCDLYRGQRESPCELRACALHDQCYDQYHCSAGSVSGVPQSACDQTQECTNCNRMVLMMLLNCHSTGLGDSSYGPQFYCAAKHRFVDIPGEYTSRERAEKDCEHDDSEDCDLSPRRPALSLSLHFRGFGPFPWD